MAIIFENIETGHTAGVSREKSGRFYEAKLSALVNSSDMSVNADRGQDKGWRLDSGQRAELEDMKGNPDTVAKVSEYTRVPVDNLTNADFLMYMLYLEERGKSTTAGRNDRRQKAEDDYRRRVAEAQKKEEKEPTKAEMIEQAKSEGLELDVTQKNTVAEIKKAIEEARQNSDKE